MRVTINHEYKPTPQELAQAWWSMDSKEQALFFNELGDIFDGHTFPEMQLQYLTDDPRLNRLGRRVMKAIGDYSEPSK